MPYNKLFSPIKIGNVTIKNRISMAAMGAGFHNESHGFEQNFVDYYAARAKGGVGLIFTSCSTVDLTLCGRTDFWQTDVHTPAHIPLIRNMADTLHKYDCKLAVQLVHPGRNGYADNNDGQQPVAPSAIAENENMELPRELTVEEIKYLVGKFVETAGYCFEAGVDGIELHGAHGYLIGSFISRRSNERTDEYGGSLENRLRFAKEIIEGIKAIMPKDRFLAFRLNGNDDTEGGIEEEEALEAALLLESYGIDALNITPAAITLTEVTSAIDATVTAIPTAGSDVTVTAGEAAKIAAGKLTSGKSYAVVYETKAGTPATKYVEVAVTLGSSVEGFFTTTDGISFTACGATDVAVADMHYYKKVTISDGEYAVKVIKIQ